MSRNSVRLDGTQFRGQINILNLTKRKTSGSGQPLIQVEVADGLAGGRIFGLFHGFFELLGEDVFLVGFLEEGIRELIFALPLLLLEDIRRLGEVHVGPGPYMSFVRKHRAKDRINDELGLAAGACHAQVFALLSHEGIVRQATPSVTALQILPSGISPREYTCTFLKYGPQNTPHLADFDAGTTLRQQNRSPVLEAKQKPSLVFGEYPRESGRPQERVFSVCQQSVRARRDALILPSL